MKKLALLAACAFVMLASSARADDKTIVLKTYVIHGRADRPLVVTEISRAPVASTLSALNKPLTDHVERAVSSSPF